MRSIFSSPFNNLIILSSGHLYPVRVALPLLLGYAAFNKPVSTTALWKLATEETYRHVHFRGEASDTDADFDDLEDIGTPILTVTKSFCQLKKNALFFKISF